MRLAFIVSHPIQYYAPLYRELAGRIRQAEKRGRDKERERLRDAGAKKLQTDDGIPAADDPGCISALKVFFTWREAGPALDRQFGKEFAWDIPLMEGYDFEVVPNTSPDPGTHHRRGLINPDLVERVKAWKPDAVHITGYNYISHGQAIKALSREGIPVLFRGDSHLLDGRGPWWWLKKGWLSKVYRRPSAFLYVGQANRDYYRTFGVPEEKLFPVPHTIDVGRFAEPDEELEAKALAWRRELRIPDDHFVFLYAAKLEPRKRPMELLEAFLAADLPKTTLLFVGSGELEEALKEKAKGISHGLTRIKGRISPGGFADRTGQECSSPGIAYGPSTAKTPSVPGSRKGPPEGAENCPLPAANSAHRVVFVPFQNQSVMPVVYRLGDALVLPSAYGETWGLAVNEAQACGRPALVSDRVGCAADLVRDGENGSIFRADDWQDCISKMRRMADGGWRSKREAIRCAAAAFDTKRGADALVSSLEAVVSAKVSSAQR